MSHFKRQRDQLQQFFDSYAPEAAQQSRFTQRRSKLTGSLFAKALVLGWLQHPEGGLEQIAKVCQDFGVMISRQGLDERMKPETVMFLALLFDQSLRHFRQQGGIQPEVLAHFTAVRIVDSTQLQLPTALRELFASCRPEQASLKTHLCFDYLSGCLEALEWVAGNQPDQNCRLHQQWADKGSLLLFDLGYFKQQVLAAIAEQEAFFVCRLQSQTALYQAGERLDLAAFVSALPNQLTEVTVQMGRLTHLPVRLILQPVPEPVAAERRRKAQAKAKRQKKTCSQAYLTLLGWNLFITNAPADWLPAEQVSLLYRLRWQIELIFKAWKSQLRLAHLGHWRAERVFCQLYARFIGIVLCHWLMAPYRFLPTGTLSLTKAVQVILDHLPQLRRVAAHRWRGLLALLTQLKHDFLRFARQEPRKKSPSTLDLLTFKP